MEWVNRKLAGNRVDFVGKRVPFGIASAVLVVLSWVVFFVVGPNWGIDFTGGTEINLRFAQTTSIDEVRSALTTLGVSDDAVQSLGNDDLEYRIRIQDASFGADRMREDVESRIIAVMGPNFLDPARTQFDAEVGARLVLGYNGDAASLDTVREALSSLDGASVQDGREEREIVVTLPGLSTQMKAEIATAMGDREFEVLSTEAVGPKVGGELRQQGFAAVVATLGLVLLYVAFRFELAFAPGAVIALMHDVSLTVGVFVLMGKLVPDRFEFNLSLIGALLTIVGYSLNDTIVIYDRIRENRERYRRQDTAELINTSINETLTRTIATSGTTALAMLPFLVIGGPVIEDFAFAMIFGIVVGTYSTIYVASPSIIFLEQLLPKMGSAVALSGKVEETEEEKAAREATMTQSERRRRERADRQRDGSAET